MRRPVKPYPIDFYCRDDHIGAFSKCNWIHFLSNVGQLLMFCKEGSFTAHVVCVMCIHLCIVHGVFSGKLCRVPPKAPLGFFYFHGSSLSIFAWVFFLSYPSFLMCTTCCSSLFRNTSSVPNALQQNEFCDPWRILEPRNVPKNWNSFSSNPLFDHMGHGVKLPGLITPWMIHVSMKSVIYLFKSRLTSLKNLIKDQSLNQPCYGGFEWCPYSTSGWTTRLLLKRPLLFVI